MPQTLIEVNTKNILELSNEIEELTSKFKSSIATISNEDKQLFNLKLLENQQQFAFGLQLLRDREKDQQQQIKQISSSRPQTPEFQVAPPPLPSTEEEELEEEEITEKKQQRPSLLPTTGLIDYVPPGKLIPVISGRYGEQRPSGTHGGTDLAISEGTPLRAISDGRIVDGGNDPNGWGNFIVYLDNKGIYHLYGHIQNGYRGGGDIKKGDIIAKVGMTGRVTGPHLHWETGSGWNGGVLIGKFDPLNRYSMNAPFSASKESQVSATKSTSPSQSIVSKTSSTPSPTVIIQQSASKPQSSYSQASSSPMLNSNSKTGITREEIYFATV